MTVAQTSATPRLPIDGRHRQMFIDGAWVDACAGRTMEPPAAA